MPPARSAVFAGTVESWNDAIFRLWVDRAGNESSANIWLSSAWGMDPEKIERFRDRITPVMRQLFDEEKAEAST